jgi:type III restriction enzyme
VTVIRWVKPGKGDFQIRYSKDSDYEPDFVVETDKEKYLFEPKRMDQMQDPVVEAKARAALSETYGISRLAAQVHRENRLRVT